MTRTLLLSVAVLGVAAALAVGSYSALAGSNPVGGVADAVVGADGTHTDGNGTDDVNDAEGDGEDVEDANVQDEGDTGAGAEHVAGVIADAFGADQGEVLALHEQGIGFGALFKLYALAQATGTTVDDLLASIDADADGGQGYAFGKRFKELTEEQRAVLESGPKNLGQLVSASNHPDEDGEAEADAASQAAGEGAGEVRGQLLARPWAAGRRPGARSQLAGWNPESGGRRARRLFVRFPVKPPPARNKPPRPTAIRDEYTIFDEEEITVSRIQRIVALAAVGLFGAIGVTGVMAGAGGVFGGSSDDSTAAAESVDTQTPDSLVAQSGDTPDGDERGVADQQPAASSATSATTRATTMTRATMRTTPMARRSRVTSSPARPARTRTSSSSRTHMSSRSPARSSAL